MNAQSTKNQGEEFDTEALAQLMAELTWDMKGQNTVAIDVRGRVSYTDFVVITTGTSERHVQALVKHVEQHVKEHTGIKVYGREGMETGRWALVDFGDAILHVFNGSARNDYDLERMWTDAPRLELLKKPKSLYGHFEMNEFE